MAGLAWPMMCASCSADVKVEGDAFAVWKCGKDHYFATCGEGCQRMFGKKSKKVSDAVERRVGNEGQRDALRRLPPGEKEKVKQKAKADSTEGMLLCPADAKVGDRDVPHCAHCMVRCGGQAQEHSNAAPPPPPRLAAGQSPAAGGACAVGLVDDDQLVVLKKESDVIEEEAAPTKKKGKAKKGKESDVIEEEAAPTTKKGKGKNGKEKKAYNPWDLPASAAEQGTSPADRAAEEEQRRRRAEEERRLAEEAERNRKHNLVVEAALTSGPPWECVCTELWRPLPNVQDTMQLLEGERVQVFWMQEDRDGRACRDGWAWGHTLEDPTKYAYFPLAVLETMRREAKPRKAGEVFATTKRFDAPQEIGGFLSVAAGDRVRLLHPIERPYVWAYAQRISDGESSHDGSPNKGWLPEVVLCDAQNRD